MKKHLGISLIALITVAFPIAALADDAVDASGAVNVNSSVNSGPANASIKARIQADYELRMKNLKENQDNRNMMLGVRKDMASTTKAERMDIRDDRREEVRDIRTDARADWKNASTTGERREIRMDMRMDVFKVRLNAFVRQLNVSLDNLVQISGRISDRIAKAEGEGRDMTEAKALLVTATAKIDAARTAISVVASTTPAAAGATASSTVDLSKPRELGSAAIKALNDARKALQDVVVAIAHAMGLRVGIDGKITASTTASTTAQ